METNKPKNSEHYFTELESCFNTLNNIGIHLKNTVEFLDDVFEKFLKISDEFEIEYKREKGTSKIPKEEFEREFWKSMNSNPEIVKGKKYSMILLEHLIINLYKLIEIHPTLVKNLKKMDEDLLEKSLQDFWQPIQNQEKRIKNWRNKIIAHAEYSAKKMVTYPKVDENFESFPEKIHLLSNYGILYISGISLNIPEFKNAIESHQRQMKYPKNVFKIIEWEMNQVKIGKLIKIVKKTLEKNGYQNEIDEILGRKYPRSKFM